MSKQGLIDAKKLEEDIRLRYCKDCSNHYGNKCRCCHVDDMLGEIEDAPTVNPFKWISVKDKMPKQFESVLGYMTDAGDFPPVRECYRVGGTFYFPALKDRHPVSHWMPMPEAPKGGDTNE